jgi:hypothetical protein
MTENQPNEPELGDELHNLGKNLSEFFHAMWESEERRKVQKDIENGISELGTTIHKAATDFSQTKTGQQMKADVKDLKARLQNGEVQEKARQEMLAALKRINQELTRAAERWNSASTSEASTPTDQPDTSFGESGTGTPDN